VSLSGGVIFLQFLSSKYLELLSRYRELTKEYRKGGAGHRLLQPQIRAYRSRLRLNMVGSWLACLAVFSFITAVIMGGVSMVFLSAAAADAVGTVTLFFGLLLIGVSVLLELVENILSRRELAEEVEDLDEPAKTAD